MNNRLEIKLWLAHRLTGMALGLFVIIHLVTILVVIKGGLSAAEVMERTSSNFIVAIFYGLFVIAAAVHSAIGLRTVAYEVLNWKRSTLNVMALIFFAFLCVVGIAAIIGLVQ